MKGEPIDPKPPPDWRVGALIGIVMPMFSVAFTYVSGTFWLEDAHLAAIVLAVGGVLGLVVSLEHVAQSIHYATGTSVVLSRLLSGGFEIGIIGLELGYVTKPDALDATIRLGLMVTLAVIVAALNIYAFHLYRWFRRREKVS